MDAIMLPSRNLLRTKSVFVDNSSCFKSSSFNNFSDYELDDSNSGLFSHVSDCFFGMHGLIAKKEFSRRSGEKR